MLSKWVVDKESELVPRLLDLEESKKSIIIGTVYMEMQMKPNILRELTAEATRTLMDNRMMVCFYRSKLLLSQ